LNKTGQSVAEEVGKLMVEKSKNFELTNSFQTFFNDWVAINEKHYTQLYATKEFSKLKAELTTLSLDVKKNIEQQFENRIEHLPLVVKSELNELYQTIHDLKKTIKALESKVNTTAKTAAAKTTAAATTTTAKTATTAATTATATATAKKATV
jgi:polyhydroxyalkanoate synthesis regulator phasin